MHEPLKHCQEGKMNESETTTLEEIMWENALQSKHIERVQVDCSEKTSLRNWIGRHSSHIWALIYALCGFGCFVVVREGFIHSLGEFLMLAGLLTLSVDPFLKRRLQTETAEDIFHHLLGINLPLAIRNTLKDFLLHSKYYREDVEITATVNLLSDESRVEVILTMTAVVIALKRLEYCQHVSFEESENGSILEASVTSLLNQSKSYTERDFQMKTNSVDSEVQEWSGHPIKLDRDEHLNTFVKYRIERPSRDFYPFFFGSAVIKPRLRLYGCKNLAVSASAADQINGNEYVYDRVFVEGDHFQIRWKPISSVP
jgi:hypothetical protein